MKNVFFHPKSKEAEIIVDQPTPGNKNIPEWYKKIPRFSNDIFSVDENGLSNATVKMCIPFLDSFITGYIQKTWCDIHIEYSNGEVNYRYSSSPKILDHRKNNSGVPIPKEFYNIEFVWQMQWIPELPKGYSIIYTHPFNRIDLPFYSLTGIVDSDKFNVESAANHPFYIKNNFSGIIPAGTPMVQIIPFKRESWKSVFENFNLERQMLSGKNFKKFFGNYKDNFWSRKQFK